MEAKEIWQRNPEGNTGGRHVLMSGDECPDVLPVGEASTGSTLEYFPVYLLTFIKIYSEKPGYIFSDHCIPLRAASFILRPEEALGQPLWVVLPQAQRNYKGLMLQERNMECKILPSASLCSLLLIKDAAWAWADWGREKGSPGSWGQCLPSSHRIKGMQCGCTSVCLSVPTWLLWNENFGCLKHRSWNRVCSVGLGKAVVPEGKFQGVLNTILYK